VYLSEPGQVGEYRIASLSLTEIGSSKPAADEAIILYLGDSLTITSYLPFEQRVDAVVQGMLAKESPAAARKMRPINFAADGEYVKELVGTGRFRTCIKENFERIDVAIVRYGSNDMKQGPPEEFRRQLGDLCDELAKGYPGVTILLATGTCISGAADINAKYAPYWQVSRDLAAQRKLGLIDVAARFEKEASDKLTKSSGDMHPTAEGVRVTAEEVFKALKALPPKAGDRGR
jgi:lysophospholipase L1-like esterase